MFGHRSQPASVSYVDAPDEAARANPVIGWGFLLAAVLVGAVLPSWGAPLPWQVTAGCAGLALAWPGAHSPRGCLRAGVRRWADRRAHARLGAYAPAPAGASADVPAAHVDVRARAAWAGGCAGVLALAWAGASGRWPVLAVGVAAGVGMIVYHFRGILFRPGGAAALTLLDVSSGGGAEGLVQWQAEVLDRWYDGVRQVPGLTLREDPEDVDEGQARRVLAYVEIVGDDVRAVPGGVTFAVDTRVAMKRVEHVAAAVDQLGAILDADTVLIERVPARASFAVLTAYRGRPFYGRPMVDWRNLRPVDDAELVPVGETANADLLGQDAPPPRRGLRPAITGRQAILSARESLFIVGEVNRGKSAALRAKMRGQLVQRIPFRPVVLDNKGEWRGLRRPIEEMGGLYVDHPSGWPDAVQWVWGIAESRYDQMGGEFVHSWTDAEPLMNVIVPEWIDMVRWGNSSGKVGKETLDLLSQIPRRHRGSSVTLDTTAQAGQQSIVSAAREFFPQRALLRIPNDDQVEMVLGKDMLRLGARPHLIAPEDAGVFYAIHRDTGMPYMGRFAWIPREDVDSALAHPMIELGRRMAAAEEEV